MLKRQLVVGAVALMAATGAFAQAAGANTARYLAANCANCHGTNGNALNVQGLGQMKPLAGYDKEKFVTMMTEFKTGKRPASLMHQISKGYNDAQIATMAEYFSTQTAQR